MKKSKKIAMIVAAAMICVGMVVSLGAMLAMNFDFTKMSTISFETKIYSIDKAFSNITINESNCNVRLYPSKDGTCKVVCQESNNTPYSIAVKDDTLHIEHHNNRKWYEYIGIYWGTQEIGIYLPQNSYKALSATTLSSNIVIPEGFNFDSVNVQSNSGNIELFALVNEKLSVKTGSGNAYIGKATAGTLIAQASSGKVTIENVNVQTDIQAKATSGNIVLSDVQSKTISSTTKSGKVIFTKVVADERISIESTSGNVKLQKSDAGTVWIKTSSGNVSGTLLTEKVFLTDTGSGRVDVPKSASGGKCEISTGSGNIKFN